MRLILLIFLLLFSTGCSKIARFEPCWGGYQITDERFYFRIGTINSDQYTTLHPSDFGDDQRFLYEILPAQKTMYGFWLRREF
jgi:hypothetical protein